MAKEFEYTCKTQAEFVQMFIEHKTGFKVNSDADYEIHIFYKNGKEFHMNANKTEGTFARAGIKAGIIATKLETIHFGNISDLEYYVEKFNMVSFWKLKALKDENAAIVFEFITEIIDKTKTSKYYSNDKIVRMLRGFKFNTNTSFNLFMTLDLHYITEFSFETLVLFSEYMKKQLGYVDTSSKQEVIIMTTTKTTVSTTPATEEAPATAETPENKLQALLKNQYIVKQCSEKNGFLLVTVLINEKQNVVTACNRVYNLFKKQYHFTVSLDFSAIKADTDFNFGKSTIYFSAEINSLQFFLKIDELQNGVKEEVKLTNLDIISRIDKLELTTVEHKNNECCYVTVKSCFNEKTGLTHEQIFNALTGVYDADSEEKKIIAKLLQPITTKALAKYITDKQNLNFALTHTEILLRVFKNEKEFSVIKSRRISIFDMIEFDKNVLKAFHKALADNRQDAAAAVNANQQIEKLITEIQKHIVYPCLKPVYIDTTKKGLFYRLIKRSVNKATATHTTYNKTNVTAFINGYVLASYNNRLKDYLDGIKPPKNN